MIVYLLIVLVRKLGIIDIRSGMGESIFRKVIAKLLRELKVATVDFAQIILLNLKRILKILNNEMISISDPELKARVSFSIWPSEQIEYNLANNLQILQW